MRKNHVFRFSIMVVALFVVVYSCKKASFSDSSQEAARASLNSWLKTLNPNVKQASPKLAELLNKLDYTESIQIQKSDHSILTLIRLKEDTIGNNQRYFGLLFTQNIYMVEGIYETSGLEVLNQYFSQGLLAPSQSFKVLNLLGKPLYGRMATMDGKQLSMMRDSKPREATRKKPDISSDKKVNLYETPACLVDWYWITYDLNTGDIISAIYMYSEDCNYQTVDAGGPPDPGGSNNNPTNPSTPAPIAAKLCQSYAWGKVGASYNATINKVYYNFGFACVLGDPHPNLKARIEQICVTIPSYGGGTAADATELFNKAFNSATADIAELIRLGIGPPSDESITTMLNQYLKTYIAVAKAGAIVSNTGCDSRIPQTTLGANSFC